MADVSGPGGRQEAQTVSARFAERGRGASGTFSQRHGPASGSRSERPSSEPGSSSGLGRGLVHGPAKPGSRDHCAAAVNVPQVVVTSAVNCCDPPTDSAEDPGLIAIERMWSRTTTVAEADAEVEALLVATTW